MYIKDIYFWLYKYHKTKFLGVSVSLYSVFVSFPRWASSSAGRARQIHCTAPSSMRPPTCRACSGRPGAGANGAMGAGDFWAGKGHGSCIFFCDITILVKNKSPSNPSSRKLGRNMMKYYMIIWYKMGVFLGFVASKSSPLQPLWLYQKAPRPDLSKRIIPLSKGT